MAGRGFGFWAGRILLGEENVGENGGKLAKFTVARPPAVAHSAFIIQP